MKLYGDKRAPAVLLFKGCSDIDENLIAGLAKDYCVIVAEACRPADVELYMNKRHPEGLFAICGAPDGWKLIHEILDRQKIHADKIIVGNYENAFGTLIVPMLKEYALEAAIFRESCSPAAV